MGTEHPSLLRARDRQARDSSSPLWREHWNHRLMVRGRLKFKGSYAACLIAREAFAAEPYRIVDCTGSAMVTNR